VIVVVRGHRVVGRVDHVDLDRRADRPAEAVDVGAGLGPARAGTLDVVDEGPVDDVRADGATRRVHVRVGGDLPQRVLAAVGAGDLFLLERAAERVAHNVVLFLHGPGAGRALADVRPLGEEHLAGAVLGDRVDHVAELVGGGDHEQLAHVVLVRGRRRRHAAGGVLLRLADREHVAGQRVVRGVGDEVVGGLLVLATALVTG
jgi:hypothetical protein